MLVGLAVIVSVVALTMLMSVSAAGDKVRGEEIENQADDGGPVLTRDPDEDMPGDPVWME